MTSTIEILSDQISKRQIIIGENTTTFINSQTKLDEDGKATVIDEAMKILSHCIKPGVEGDITNIAVGYVQSGKTMSFTTLTALAADNGYRVIIYLTGTKTNLQSQTSDRLSNDLQVFDTDAYKLFSNIDENASVEDNVKNYLELSDEVLLFPILKHYVHISKLAKVFSCPILKGIMRKVGAIIVDDEADQSSFNTYAKKNAKSPDWENDDFSKTYTSILELKKSLPSHSYIQYTATPQAAFLIDNNDILSPVYHTVLTPGKGYTGGKFFFKNDKYRLINIIPDEEIYNYKKNPLESCPKSLDKALLEFLVSVSLVVYLQKRKTFLSMMIHIDGRIDTNDKFASWVNAKIQGWLNILKSPDGDPGKSLLEDRFRKAYDSMTIYMDRPPMFREMMSKMLKVILKTEIHVVQSRGGSVSEQGIIWKSAKAHILIGADMLNRGFTIENLSMTYMPRTTQGKSNADTIEQRCRFFGYKMGYIDVCRIYLSSKSLVEYNYYVEHEENLRTNLRQCETLKEFSSHSQAMLMADCLNPTRTNILSSDLVRHKLSGWKQLLSLDRIDYNKTIYKEMLGSLTESFSPCTDYGDNIIRCHRYAKLPINSFIDFFKKVKFDDVPNFTRKIVTIQYLNYLRDELNKEYVYIYEMAYKAIELKDLRDRKISSDNKPNNLQAGRAENGSYPGDKYFKCEDSLSIQIHHIRINQPLHSLNGKDLYNMCIYYPDTLATSFVGVEDEDELVDD